MCYVLFVSLTEWVRDNVVLSVARGPSVWVACAWCTRLFVYSLCAAVCGSLTTGASDTQ